MKIVNCMNAYTFPNDMYANEISITSLIEFSKNLWEYDRLTGKIRSRKTPGVTICQIEPISKVDIEKCSTLPRFLWQDSALEGIDHTYRDNFAVLHFRRGKLISNFPQIVGGLIDRNQQLEKELKRVNHDLEITKKLLGIEKESDFSNVLGVVEDISGEEGE